MAGIHSDKNYRKLANYKWTRRMNYSIYNAYPIYDWKTQDIWIANGSSVGHIIICMICIIKQGCLCPGNVWRANSYPKRYPTLFIYKVVRSRHVGRMVGRVNGVGFAGIYGNTSAMGWRAIKCPAGSLGRNICIFS